MVGLTNTHGQCTYLVAVLSVIVNVWFSGIRHPHWSEYRWVSGEWCPPSGPLDPSTRRRFFLMQRLRCYTDESPRLGAVPGLQAQAEGQVEAGSVQSLTIACRIKIKPIVERVRA
jgi:hypothetical protein